MFGIFGKKAAHPQLVAFRLEFEGVGIYEMSFDFTDFGVVFEDNGETGYLYATNAEASHIYDAVHIYDSNTDDQFRPGAEVFIVWNAAAAKMGLYANGKFQAVIDYAERRSFCRSGFPPAVGDWRCDHAWIHGVDAELGSP